MRGAPMSFSLDLQKFAKKAGNNAAAVVKKVGIDMFSQVVVRTPVDTGRARGNWQVTFNSPASGTLNDLDPTGRNTQAQISGKMTGWKQGDIWMTNNLPYARRLEYGWSQQAPAGFVRITVREFQTYVNNAVRSEAK